MKRPGVFLDRDGVLNEPVVRNGKPYQPAFADDITLCDGVEDALRKLRDVGFALIVVTNQPDISRETTSAEAVEQINNRLRAMLDLDDILVCPHDDADDCDCRKPRPGLLFRGAMRHNIDLQRSFMIGDRWRDIEAGASAGCRTALIDRCYDERQSSVAPDARFRSILEAANWVISNQLEFPLAKKDNDAPLRDYFED